MNEEVGTVAEPQAPQSTSSLTSGDSGGPSSLTTEAPPEKTGTFKDQLPDDLKGLSSMENISTIADLVKSHDHAQRMVGKSRLDMPTETDDPKVWDDFYKSVGRPDSADNYQLWDGDEPKMPDGLSRDEDMEKFFKGKMHERGLSNKQARGIYEDFLEFQKLQVGMKSEKMENTYKEWDGQAREMFGLAYDEKLASGQRLIQKIGDPEFNDLLDQTGLSQHPVGLRVFSKLAEMMGEHVVSGQAGRTSPSLTPEAARADIAALEKDPKFMASYLNSTDTGHEEAVKKMQNLFNFAYPALEE